MFEPDPKLVKAVEAVVDILLAPPHSRSIDAVRQMTLFEVAMLAAALQDNFRSVSEKHRNNPKFDVKFPSTEAKDVDFPGGSDEPLVVG